jgi:predicted TPR repeat methyltransferase
VSTKTSALAKAADPVLADILSRYAGGKLSAPVTLMQLLIETENADVVRDVVSDFAHGSADPGAQRRARDLEHLMQTNRAGCERIAAMLRADVDSPEPARSVEEGIAFCERLFDWSVQQSEEASVALYSLGNPALLEQATAEIVSQLRRWDLLTNQTDVLDIGCGIGRLLVALAPHVRRAVGIDVSAEMVKAAQRRCEGYENVSVIKGDGHGLGAVADDQFDLIVAVDSFPYLRQSGYALVETFVADSARALKSRGQLVILNYSYSENDETDDREIRDLAAENGLDVVSSGERPFHLWDAVAFRLRTR